MILVLGVTTGSLQDTSPLAFAGSTRSGNSNVTSSTARHSSTAQEKGMRTPAQKKIDSQLLYALYRKRGEAESKGVPPGELSVRFDAEGRAIVSIRARVTKTVLAKIKSTGGKVISSFERYHDIRAHVRLEKLEALAALKDVYAIMPAQEATTNSTR
jgi:hypothetical protein